MTTDDKLAAYRSTVLEFAGAPPLALDLRRPLTDAARRALAERGLDGPFAVLTAENPRGRNADDASTRAEERARDARNERRVSQLETELRALGVPHRQVDGVAPDGDYREHCVAVRLEREAAVALAARHAQLALFWFDGARFWLLPAAADGAPTPLPG